MSTALQVAKTYWKNVRRRKWLVVLALLSFVLSSVLMMTTPLYFKRFFDLMSGGWKPGVETALAGTLLMIALINVGRIVMSRIANTASNYAQSWVMSSTIDNSFFYVLGHSSRFFANTFTGSLVRKITRLARSFEDMEDAIKFQIIPLVVSITAAIIIICSRNPILMIPVAVWIAIYTAGSWLFIRWVSKYNKKSAALDSEISGALADSLTGNVNVGLFNGFAHEFNIVSSLTESIRRLRVFRWTAYDIMFAVQFCLNVAIELVVLYLAIGYWKRGELTLGDFVLLQAIINIISENLWNIANIFRRFSDALADAGEMVDILDTPHEIKDAPGAKKLVVSSGAISFNKVGFNYNETRTILKNFSLDIRPGEKVALVGPSGAGKSTIIKILFRSYDLASGKILVDGQDIAKVTQDSLHDALSLVPQDPILFHRSLADNIRYGRRKASDKEVIAAAKKAHCHEFITALPEGYKTLVGERGIKLSGGERQRVAIARAILKDSPILVLDEATSSLDSESEHLIHEALHELMKNKTVIVIAHRLSTIMEMDRIVVLENGKVTDMGTHEELLKRTGTYKKLWEIQAGGFLP